nr:sugar transferase [Sphingomonas xinjiangensis]
MPVRYDWGTAVNAHQEVLPLTSWNTGKAAKRSGSRRNLRFALYAELCLLDLLSIALGPVAANIVLRALGLPEFEHLIVAALLPLYGVLAVSRGAYSRTALERASESIRRASVALALSVLLILVIAFFLSSPSEVSRFGLAVSVLVSASCMCFGRVLIARHAHSLSGGKLINELVIVDGVDEVVNSKFGVVLDAKSVGLEPNLHNPTMLSFFGSIVSNFDRVIIHSVGPNHRAWSLLLKGANVNGEIVMHSANEIGAIAVGDWNGRHTLVVARQPLSIPNRMKKRILDLAICLPLLVLLSPLLVTIALAIKFDTPGPVLFKQDRVGRGNRLFKVLKFRSMRNDLRDTVGSRSASRDDDRVTRIGRFIRATSIDELPQLINVALGDMSLVGPRPHALGSLAGDRLFWQTVDETYWLRHQLKPGITGLAQVRGYRGATAEATDLIDRLQSDMEYIQGWDIWRDLAILANTFRVIVHRNAY